MAVQGQRRTWEAWSRMAQVLKCSSKCGHLLEEEACLHSLSQVCPSPAQAEKTEKRPLRKTKILWATRSPASESLCDPSATLDQLQGESFYWNVTRPDLSSGKRQAGRQAAFCTLSLILGAGVERGVGPWCRLAHTSTHRLSRAE